MGRSESATMFTGIKILLGNLFDQITEENEDLILEMMEEGFIEDENETFNEDFRGSLEYFNIDENPREYFSDLLEKYLLVPVPSRPIIDMCRWGRGREGINAVSADFTTIETPNLEKYKGLKDFKTVFILQQNSS
jgi:hypothetical protein